MKFLCKRCGWFIQYDGYEWSDDMGHFKCVGNEVHEPTGTGVEFDEKLRIR